MLSHARRTEVGALAANGNDERVVNKSPPWSHFLALLVEVGGQLNFTPLSIEADHLANAVTKVVPVRLREIVDLVHRKIHASGSDFMQKRLPQVGARFVDQRDVCKLASTELVA